MYKFEYTQSPYRVFKADPEHFAWPIFQVPITSVIEFLESNSVFQGSCTQAWVISRLATLSPREIRKLHNLYSREFPEPFHLNVSSPAIEESPEPFEEGELQLIVALLKSLDPVPVIISGELELAEQLGLISSPQLIAYQHYLSKALQAENAES